MKRKKLEDEANRMTEMLKGKVVKICKKHRSAEVVLQFECGTTLFVDAEGALEVSRLLVARRDKMEG
jgi:hypothetical protein